ncbi:MerR family transcriptional regulator [Alicyclobacillus sp. ALC3]|uniref:MerR family transcriptional regulator n=1 Tax=Alicyclobacillus sp. ALC3 TaxID=2796143 RepID=UPI002378A9A3|nr:MerR family transcriptional regulator [Alicyclobacillus sp. ALC3]WDL98616.1 MerR family transcriptional regulator [Alicyclobacillus sp. ALC3]
MTSGLYSIGEAAKLTGLSVKAIRHYANEGVVTPAARSEAGYRLYATDDIWRLTLVRQLREMEFGLPQISRILNQAADVATVIDWHKRALDLQITHLTDIRARLDLIPQDAVGESSFAHLHIVLEAMKMSTEEKKAWLEARWSETMIPDTATDDWRTAFLQQLKESLPTQWGAEQTAAWTDLQALLNDPQFRDEMQQMVQPFWQMIDHGRVQPEPWSQSMGALMDHAIAAQQAGHGPESARVQAVVDEWIDLFANAFHMPVDDTFLQRFRHYAETVENAPNQQLWDIMARLNPEKMAPPLHAQKLMLAGLRWRMEQK